MSRSALVALVVANAFVAFQAFRHEWGYYEVMLIYWVEVVILGCYNVFRMLVVGVIGAAPLGAWAARWVNLGGTLNRFGLTAIGVGFFVVKFGALRTYHRALRPPAAGVLGLSHGVSFVRNFLVGHEYDRIDVVSLAFWPYVRMSLVAVTLLLGVDPMSHVFEHRRLAAERTSA